jgi:hypothetical protein
MAPPLEIQGREVEAILEAALPVRPWSTDDQIRLVKQVDDLLRKRQG